MKGSLKEFEEKTESDPAQDPRERTYYGHKGSDTNYGWYRKCKLQSKAEWVSCPKTEVH